MRILSNNVKPKRMITKSADRMRNANVTHVQVVLAPVEPISKNINLEFINIRF